MKARPPPTFQLAEGVPSGVRLPQFDALKGVAMALVLGYHWRGAASIPGPDPLKGEVGVDIFLIVSGILLGINSQDLRPGAFLRRRFFRLFPTYWVALTVFLLLNAHFFGDRRPAADIWLHFAGLHGFSRPEFFASIDDSFWFISIIVLLYAAFLCLRPWLHNLGLVTAVGAFLTFGLCNYYDWTRNGGGAGDLAVRIPSVFLGLILGRIASGRPVEFRFEPVGVAGLALLAYMGIHRWYVFEYPLLGLAWVAGFLAVDRWLRRRHGGRVFLSGLSFLGIYSYEIYLIHQPLIRDYSRLALAAWWQVLSPSPAQLFAGMAAGLAITLAVSVVLHKAMDRLFGSLRKRPA